MNPTERQAIRNLAVIVRRWLAMETPIDVESAVVKLNGQIRTDATLDHEAKIEMRRDSFVISLRDQDANRARRRFTIAHELGHLFLHLDYLKSDEELTEPKNYEDSVRYRYGYSIEEYEANEFAASLLMPEDEFRQEVREASEDGECDLKRVAERFGVSLEAARTRGRWLGLFRWPAI